MFCFMAVRPEGLSPGSIASPPVWRLPPGRLCRNPVLNPRVARPGAYSPAIGIQALRFFEMRDGFRHVAGFVEILPQAELGGCESQTRVLWREVLPQPVFAEDVFALFAFFRPVAKSGDVRFCF